MVRGRMRAARGSLLWLDIISDGVSSGAKSESMGRLLRGGEGRGHGIFSRNHALLK